MATVPALPSIVGGILPTSTQSQIVQAVSFLFNRPSAELRQATVQSIANTTWTPLTFDASDFDNAGGHNNVTNNSRYTAQYAGWYLLGGAYATAQNATGQRGAKWTINGSDLTGSGIFMPAISASGDVIPARTKQVFLNVGDYVELNAWQNSTAALNTDVSVNYIQSSMSILFAHL